GSGHVLSGNVASANGGGFSFLGKGHVLTGNLASANGTQGFAFIGSGHVLTGNAALGNRGPGIAINDAIVESATITKNNLFGNNSSNFGGFTNCGLLNRSGDPINASDNFWGAASGPGSDPADNVCNSGAGSTTTVAPPATKEFKIKTLTPVDEPGLIVPADSEQSEISQAPSSMPIQFLKEIQTKEALLFRVTGNVSALRLEVIDLAGRKIYDSGFVNGQEFSWTRMDVGYKPVANGVYLYQLTARDREDGEISSELRKLVVRR
ncbi:hypothetical protein HY009_01370, partial [Candidatus Acetothermia bacterium]|nr:hypothetical protein [Candidatus Acetothermia bacterium]